MCWPPHQVPGQPELQDDTVSVCLSLCPSIHLPTHNSFSTLGCDFVAPPIRNMDYFSTSWIWACPVALANTKLQKRWYASSEIEPRDPFCFCSPTAIFLLLGHLLPYAHLNPGHENKPRLACWLKRGIWLGCPWHYNWRPANLRAGWQLTRDTWLSLLRPEGCPALAQARDWPTKF